MHHLKLNSELTIFGTKYSVTKITKNGILFKLAENKDNAANELELSLSEVEKIIFQGNK